MLRFLKDNLATKEPVGIIVRVCKTPSLSLSRPLKHGSGIFCLYKRESRDMSPRSEVSGTQQEPLPCQAGTRISHL